MLAGLFGPILRKTPLAPWDHTDYYEAEFGPGLTKRLLFFERLIDQGEIREIKLAAVGLEARLSSGGKRTVNIDPGYLTEAKVVLASTKDYSHRVSLGGGVFAEVTLYHMHGSFRPHLFTYRDYMAPASIRLFEEVREAFRGLVGR